MARKFSTKSEKRAFRMGLFAGLSRKKSKKSRSNGRNNVNTSNSLLDDIKNYRNRNLGVLYYNGKYYDTNFIDKPVEITKSEIKKLRSSYDPEGKLRDIDVADRYVHHMRHKYGVYDKKTGRFLHMLGEDK